MSVRLIIGDCREKLAELADESVHCVVTSPPYFGLRDYGTAQWEGGDEACDHVERTSAECHSSSTLGPKRDGLKPDNAAFRALEKQFRAECRHCGARRIDAQIGLEPTPEAYVAELVGVFREVRRVLRKDGTLWLNLGDSYQSNGSAQVAQTKDIGTSRQGVDRRPPPSVGLKPKDLIGIPWRVGFALQADGWWLRQDLIWSKPNPMPESVTDRCTKAHEYLFLLAKSERYYFDAEAILEPVSPNTHARLSQDVAAQVGSARANGGRKTNGNMKAVGRGPKTAAAGSGIKNNDSFAAAVCLPVTHRNKRSVWEVTTQPFKEAHFATFPPGLIEPCILAGCPAKACAKCGAPWVREVEKTESSWEARKAAGHIGGLGSVKLQRLNGSTHEFDNSAGGFGTPSKRTTVGFSPSCSCNADTVPGTVLDPFGGAGTTGLVADRLQRNAILIELNPAYCTMTQSRLVDDAPLFAEVTP